MSAPAQALPRSRWRCVDNTGKLRRGAAPPAFARLERSVQSARPGGAARPLHARNAARRGKASSALRAVRSAVSSIDQPRSVARLGADPRQLGRLVAHAAPAARWAAVR